MIASLRGAFVRCFKPPAEFIAENSARSEALFVCLLLSALACGLRLTWLGSDSLRTDELFSVYWSQLDVRFLLGRGAQLETNPPLFYLLLHGWIGAAGASQVAVRLPSVLFSVATVLVTYSIGRTLMNRTTALIAGLFAAVCPISVVYGQIARPYALVALLDGLSLLALSVYLRHRARTGARPWAWLFIFVVVSIGTILTHYTSVLFVASCLAVIGIVLLATSPLPVDEIVIWGSASLVIFLAVAKPLILGISLSHSADIAWIGPLTLRTMIKFFQGVIEYPGIAPYPAASFAVLLFLIFVVALPRLRLDSIQFAGLIGVPGIFCVLLLGASISRSLLLDRVGVWLALPLCLLLAHAATAQPTRRRRAAVTVAVFLTFLFCVGHYRFVYKDEDWRGASRLIAAEPQCSGPILFGGAYGLGLLYYEQEIANRQLYTILPTKIYQTTSEFALTRTVMQPLSLENVELIEFARSHPHSAVVLRESFSIMEPSSLPEMLQGARYRWNLAGRLTVVCF